MRTDPTRSPLGEKDTKDPQGETLHEEGALWTDGLRLPAGIQGSPGAGRWEQAGQHSPWLRLETLLGVGVIWEQWATWTRSAGGSQSKHTCAHTCVHARRASGVVRAPCSRGQWRWLCRARLTLTTRWEADANRPLRYPVVFLPAPGTRTDPFGMN